ncbi:MAG: tetratricopeptide repeat protein [Bacteroidetes bacterium]|nr:tetratricopeptide repeat protein [Bacteroidota bacterium]
MKIILSSILLVFLTVVTINAQNGELDPEAAKLYNEGNKLVKSGQYEGAVTKYNQALKIDVHTNILYQKSVALKKLRKFDEAEATLHECVKIDPKFTNAYSGLGTTYYSLQQYDKAIENFTKYTELNKNEKENDKIRKFIGLSYTQLGQNAKSNGRHDQAINYLKQAVNYYDYDAAYLYLAQANIEIGNYDEALQAADKAINFRPSNSKISKGAPYYYKGLAFKGMSEKDKAVESFKVALADKEYKLNSEYELKLLK